jgi:hypothetical protein
MAGHPAVVIVGPRGELRATTSAAQDWQERLEQIAPGRFMVMMEIMASGARATASGGFRARLRDARGQWAILEASPLIGGDEDQVAVTIEGSSDLSMGWRTSVWSPSVCSEHDPQSIMIKIFESVGQAADLFDDQVDGFGAAVGNP